MTGQSRPPCIFLIAGEPSGDLIGARLMAALKRLSGDQGLRFAGVGGLRMSAEGLESLFPMSELSVMGVLEVLPHLPRLLRRIRETAAAARRIGPDAVVTIDSPEFNFRVCRRLAGAGIPRIHYVAPQVWAWRAGRAKRIGRFLDHLLLLFPFEPPFFEATGLATTVVGHPLVEEGIERADGAAFRERHAIAPGDSLVAVLPGSRHGEIKRHLPIFGAAINRLHLRLGPFRVVVPTTVPALASEIEAIVERWPVETHVIVGRDEKYGAFAASDAALTASGTATLELAIAGVPMAVAYKVNPLTAAIGRRVIRVEHIALANLVAGRRAAPEFIQEACTAEQLTPALERLLTDEGARREQRESLREVASRLGLGGPAPSEQAARTVLKVALSGHDRAGATDGQKRFSL